MGAVSAIYGYGMSIGEAACQGLSNSTNPEACQQMHGIIVRMFNGCHNVRTICTSVHERGGGIHPKTFYDVIRRFSGRGATDPRDKIFALLGLAVDDQVEARMVNPDYNMLVEDVYWEVASLHLKEHKNLDILSSGCGPNRPGGFSSWMPSWTPREPEPNLWFVEVEPDIVFCASGNLEALFSLSEQGKLLTVKGIYIDRIEKCGEPYQLRPGQMLGNKPYTPEAVTQHWGELAGVSRMLNFSPGDEITQEDIEAFSTYVAGGHKPEAFLRTMYMNPSSELNVSYCAPQHGMLLEKLYMNLDLGSTGENDAHLRSRTSFTCTDKRFFLTAKGYMGISVPEIREGDLVCVFLGAKVPFVVRKEDSSFILVGESYVQGLMAAEAIRDLEGGKLQLQDFTLK
jgi:hypothetical protein